jgi:hypothetical protein
MRYVMLIENYVSPKRFLSALFSICKLRRIITSENRLWQTTQNPARNSFGIRRFKTSVRNPFRIRTSENTGGGRGVPKEKSRP